ncbi:SAM-dependent methyltransferase [Stieleria sp. TO1_6]|uniref:class I SAM-dependent methyltransferase n=1 Tax=Stieleria tagensis TaxID=2956795 RepID=UPI00209B8988|nr:rRNA adenine N-6-methyltransferase family protein [Stieleria tagensis]MCO8122042.1 SAM-dependent methyltransferase [Stieleria tagensis]
MAVSIHSPLAPTEPSTPSFLKRALCVLKAWAKQPLQVATVLPSSSFLMDNIGQRECIAEAQIVVELGPGAGGTTEVLLQNMKPDSRLIAIEKTEAFMESLHQIQDPRLTVINGDAVNLVTILRDQGIAHADVVVSGIPFSALPADTAKKITQSIHASLHCGGTFIAYQLRSDVESFARPYFGPSRRESVPLNIPPLNVYAWQKIESGMYRNSAR